MGEFQYQPLHEGLLNYVQKCLLYALFQYQPLHEGLLSGHAGMVLKSRYFNTSPYMRGFGAMLMANGVSSVFQYQPLHEGLLLPTISKSPQTDFNTSPYMRGFPKCTPRV